MSEECIDRGYRAKISTLHFGIHECFSFGEIALWYTERNHRTHQGICGTWLMHHRSALAWAHLKFKQRFLLLDSEEHKISGKVI